MEFKPCYAPSSITSVWADDASSSFTKLRLSALLSWPSVSFHSRWLESTLVQPSLTSDRRECLLSTYSKACSFCSKSPIELMLSLSNESSCFNTLTWGRASESLLLLVSLFSEEMRLSQSLMKDSWVLAKLIKVSFYSFSFFSLSSLRLNLTTDLMSFKVVLMRICLVVRLSSTRWCSYSANSRAFLELSSAEGLTT